MNRVLLTACLAVACAFPAMAKEFQLPDANPAVSITIPDDWKPDATDTGIEATSPDGNFYIAFDTAPAKGAEDLVKDDFAFLKKSGVTVDQASEEKHEGHLNGMESIVYHWTGKDQDGPTAVTLVLLGVTPNLMALVTTWATPEAEKKYDPLVAQIAGSIHRM